MSTCIITGAGSGIGQAAAIEISKKEMFKNIILIGRTEESLRTTSCLAENPNVNIESVVQDLSSLEELPGLVSRVFKAYGSIDCLMNIAGFTDPQPLLSTSLDNISYTYTVNVFATFLMIRECTKYMKQNPNGARILNVASTAGITPRPGWLSYASSKAAVISMSQTLTEELAEYNIKVYCISPGRCATKLRQRLAPDEDPSTIMQPREVGEIICRLIDENENCLDGQNIIIRKRIHTGKQR